MLADLVQDADEKQFAVLFPKLEAHRERGVALLSETVARPWSREDGRRQGEAGQAAGQCGGGLLRLGQADAVWPLLKHPPPDRLASDRVRSYLIHRLSPLGADPGAIVQRLDEEKDVSIRRALLLTLGEFGPDQLVACRPGAVDPQGIATVPGRPRRRPARGGGVAAAAMGAAGEAQGDRGRVGQEQGEG